MEGMERLKKDTEHPRLVGGRFNEKGNLWGLPSAPQVKKISVPTCHNLKVDKEAWTGYSHVYCPDVLNNILLSEGSILENGSHCGNSGQNRTFQGQGREVRMLLCLGPAHGSTSDHVFLITSSNSVQYYLLNLEAQMSASPVILEPATCWRWQTTWFWWLQPRAPPLLSFI